MLVREILPLVPGVDRVIDLTPPADDLVTRLKVPSGVPVLSAVSGYAPGDLVLLMAGPGHADPPPVPADLPAGARVLLLCTWEVADLPYHRLLAPLGAAKCQVIDAFPLSRSGRRGPHVALMVIRVDAVVAPRAHLLDADHPLTTPDPAEPGTQLRMANEYLLGRLVERPLRRRLRRQETRLRELEAEVADLRSRLEPAATAATPPTPTTGPRPR